MNLVCNTWKGHDELGKVYHTTPKKNRRQVFAFFLFFFDNHYKSESSCKVKCIFQARSILHWTIMNLSAIKRARGLQLIQHSSNNSKHNVKLYFDEVSDGRVNSELQSVRSGSDSESRGKYELACLPSCMDFEQICCNCWCKQSINRKRYSHNNRPRTFAYKLCHSFLQSLTAGNIRSKPCKPKLLLLNVKCWRGTLAYIYIQ